MTNEELEKINRLTHRGADQFISWMRTAATMKPAIWDEIESFLKYTDDKYFHEHKKPNAL